MIFVVIVENSSSSVWQISWSEIMVKIEQISLLYGKDGKSYLLVPSVLLMETWYSQI